MGYSIERLGITVSAATIATGLLIFLLMSQIAISLLPVLGMGGFFLDIRFFQGNNGLIYPEKEPEGSGTLIHGDTDTSECESVPMLVFRLDDAQVYGYNIFKDIEVPFSNRWMSINIRQPADPTDDFDAQGPDEGTTNAVEPWEVNSAYLDANQVSFYASQISADYLELVNAEISEGEGAGNSRDWGPQSNELRFIGDPNQNAAPVDIRANNISMWAHAATGTSIVLDQNNQDSPIEFDVSYPSEQDLEDRYNRRALVGGPDPNSVQTEYNRTEYMSCLPP